MTERFSHLAMTVGPAWWMSAASRTPDARARAEAVVRRAERIMATAARERGHWKGNVVETARVAGIMAAKRTSRPHPYVPSVADRMQRRRRVYGSALSPCVTVAGCRGVTGVEMEALTAARVAALTVYDMCKSVGEGHPDRPDSPPGKIRRQIRPLARRKHVKRRRGLTTRQTQRMGTIAAICISEKKGVRKAACPMARFVENHGLEGDAHAGPGHRQVGLLDRRDIQNHA